MPKTSSVGPRTEPITHKPTSKPHVPKPGRDSEGFHNRAGCVVVSKDWQKVLLITSNGHSGKWIMPAGSIELDETPENGAIRETHEEAGVIGEIQFKLGVFTDNNKKRTHYFVLKTHEAVEDYREALFRKREWFSLEEATKLLEWRPIQHKVLLSYISCRNFAPHNNDNETCTEVSLQKSDDILDPYSLVIQQELTLTLAI